MIGVFLTFYVACQAFLFFLFGWLIIIKGEVDMNKENLFMMAAMFGFGPLGVICLFGVIQHEKLQDMNRKACQRAMNKWEHRARETYGESKTRWDWYTDGKTKESRYNLLRETIDCLTDQELDLLVKVSKATYELEKPMREAIMDEIIHRELMK